MKRWSILIVPAAIVSVGIVAWYLTSQNEPETAPLPAQPPERTDVVSPVRVSVASSGHLVQYTRANGRLRARRELELVARVAGEVSAVHAHNGKFVREGDLIVKLDDREYHLAHEKARSSLLAAQIEYRSLSATPFLQEQDSIGQEQLIARAQDALERARRAYASGMLNEEDLARAEREFETTFAYLKAQRSDVVANKSGLTAARQELERARMNLEWTEIRAPFAGYVANCDLTPGMQVQAGKVVALLIDLKTLLVDVEVLESEAGRVQSGQSVTARVVALPDQTLNGVVRQVNPIVDSKTRTMRVTIELSDGVKAPMLKPGMYAIVEIATRVLKDRLLVPREALLVRDQRNLVFRTENGHAKWCYVEVGEQNEQYIEIRSGIAAGDTIIVDGHYTLAHDARIRVTDMEER